MQPPRNPAVYEICDCQTVRVPDPMLPINAEHFSVCNYASITTRYMAISSAAGTPCTCGAELGSRTQQLTRSPAQLVTHQQRRRQAWRESSGADPATCEVRRCS